MTSLRETFKRIDKTSKRRNFKNGGSIGKKIWTFVKEVGKEAVLTAAGLSDKDKEEVSSDDLDAKLLAYLKAQEAAETDIEIGEVAAGFASSNIKGVKVDPVEKFQPRFAGETMEFSDIDLQALANLQVLKDFNDVRIKAEGPRGTTLTLASS